MQRNELIAYLDHIKSLYPFGIPENLIKESQGQSSAVKATTDAQGTLINFQGASKPKVLFIALREENSSLWDGEQGALLRAAATKGMKLSEADFALAEILASNCVGADLAKMIAELRSGLIQKSAQCLIVLGWQTALMLGFERTERRIWQQIESCPFITTHALAAVLQDPVVKKEFWEDLKLVMSKRETWE